MIKAALNTDLPTLITDLERVQSLAGKYWHPKYNLRVGQLNEKLLHAWNCTIGDLRAAKQPFDEELDSALIAGESMLRSYLPNALPWDLTMAVLLYRLASRSLLKKHDVEKRERAAKWCQMAAEIWRRSGEDGCAKFLTAQAQSLMKKADEKRKKKADVDERGGAGSRRLIL